MRKKMATTEKTSLLVGLSYFFLLSLRSKTKNFISINNKENYGIFDK